MITELQKMEVSDSLNYVLSLVSEKERWAMVSHMIYGFTLHEVGKTLGVSAGRARQIEAKGIRRIRDSYRIQYIEEALEALK